MAAYQYPTAVSTSGYVDPAIGAIRNGFIFMTNKHTEMEIFDRSLFGLPENKYSIGCDIGLLKERESALFLFNLKTRMLRGVFTPVGVAGGCIDPDAWGGKFPLQCRFRLLVGEYEIHEEKFPIFLREDSNRMRWLSGNECVLIIRRMLDTYREEHPHSVSRLSSYDYTHQPNMVPGQMNQMNGHVNGPINGHVNGPKDMSIPKGAVRTDPMNTAQPKYAYANNTQPAVVPVYQNGGIVNPNSGTKTPIYQNSPRSTFSTPSPTKMTFFPSRGLMPQSTSKSPIYPTTSSQSPIFQSGGLLNPNNNKRIVTNVGIAASPVNRHGLGYPQTSAPSPRLNPFVSPVVSNSPNLSRQLINNVAVSYPPPQSETLRDVPMYNPTKNQVPLYKPPASKLENSSDKTLKTDAINADSPDALSQYLNSLLPPLPSKQNFTPRSTENLNPAMFWLNKKNLNGLANNVNAMY